MKRTWMLLHFLLIYFGCALSFAANSLSVKDIELTKVSSQIKLLQKKIIQDRQHQDDLQQELKKTDLQIEQLSQQISNHTRLMTQEQFKLNQLLYIQKSTHNQLTKQYTSLNQHLHSAYALGQTGPLKILLNQEDPNKIQRHLFYYQRLTKARLELIKKINISLIQLKSNMREIRQHQNNFKKLVSQKKLQQKQQKIAQKQRQYLLAELHQSVKTKEHQLTSLIENQKQLQEIVTRLTAKSTSHLSQLAFTQLRGKLNWPVKGTIIANFGSALDVKDFKLPGVLIKTTEGMPVRAIHSGKVIFANSLRGFGLLIIISHNNNYMSLYGRNHMLFAKVGEQVNTGDIIANTGISDNFNNASLYFEIRKNGVPINPHMWCR